MSLWNPYAFTPTGQPVALAAPPALRVMQGQATPQQLAHAQDAFYRFCTSSRLSAVPNPTEIGALPDGSRYRIIVVGSQTIMEIWPAGGESAYKPAIGVLESGRWWLLTPPGRFLQPDGGKWSSVQVEHTFGGLGYVHPPTGNNYFVESPQGVSRQNVLLAPPLFAQTKSHFLLPLGSKTNTTSSPILAGGRIWQMSADPTGLLVLSRQAGKGVGAAASSLTLPLPDVGPDNVWGLTTSTHDGGKILVCRVGPGLGDLTVVGHVLAAFTPPSTLQIISDKSTPPEVTKCFPSGQSNAAPKFAKWVLNNDESVSTGSWSYTIPYPPLRSEDPPYTGPLSYTYEGTSTYNNKAYTQDAEYEGEGVLRSYLGVAGDEITDKVKYVHRTMIRRSYTYAAGGHINGTFATLFRDWEDQTHVELLRKTDVVLRSPERADTSVTPNTLEVEFSQSSYGADSFKSSFGEWVVGEVGNVKGYWVKEQASVSPTIVTRNLDVKKTLTLVLMHDAQFRVTATIKLEAAYTRRTRVGWSGGSSTSTRTMSDEAMERHNYFVNLALTREDRRSEYLTYTNQNEENLQVNVWLSITGESDKELDFPAGSRDALKEAMNLLFQSCSQILIPNTTGPHNETQGVRPDGMYGEDDIDEQANALIDMKLGGVHYAKDPKTGAGFFSVSWGDTVYNRLVGPWGASPISPNTALPSNAPVTNVISV